MKKGQIKKIGKKIALGIGLYRPARYLSDLLTNPVGRERIAEDTEVYKRMLVPDALCFDVGANIGAKSLSMLQAGGRVVAFEPQPDCVAELRSRCAGYGKRLQVCQKGLSSEPGELVLHSNQIHDNYASFHDDWEGDLRVDMKVDVTTLDLAIEEFGQPDYCKIDVEGWEYEVLRGLSSQIPLVSFEYHLSEREIETTRNCIEHLRSLSPAGIELNIAEPETSNFIFDKWLELDEFWKVFPGDLAEWRGFSYGDIWVRSTGARA